MPKPRKTAGPWIAVSPWQNKHDKGAGSEAPPGDEAAGYSEVELPLVVGGGGGATPAAAASDMAVDPPEATAAAHPGDESRQSEPGAEAAEAPLTVSPAAPAAAGGWATKKRKSGADIDAGSAAACPLPSGAPPEVEGSMQDAEGGPGEPQGQAGGQPAVLEGTAYLALLPNGSITGGCASLPAPACKCLLAVVQPAQLPATAVPSAPGLLLVPGDDARPLLPTHTSAPTPCGLHCVPPACRPPGVPPLHLWPRRRRRQALLRSDGRGGGGRERVHPRCRQAKPREAPALNSPFGWLACSQGGCLPGCWWCRHIAAERAIAAGLLLCVLMHSTVLTLPMPPAPAPALPAEWGVLRLTLLNFAASGGSGGGGGGGGEVSFLAERTEGDAMHLRWALQRPALVGSLPSGICPADEARNHPSTPACHSTAGGWQLRSDTGMPANTCPACHPPASLCEQGTCAVAGHRNGGAAAAGCRLQLPLRQRAAPGVRLPAAADGDSG